MILEFSTKLDSDELYCVTKTATYCLSVPSFVHFSFFPMKISFTDFSATFGVSVFKLCVHLQVGKVYFVNEKKMLKFILPFLSFFPSVTPFTTHMGHFSSVFLATTLFRRFRILKFCVHLRVENRRQNKNKHLNFQLHNTLCLPKGVHKIS